MVKIPQQEKDPTLEAMERAIEEAQDRSRRDYVGASSIGNPCARQIWYEYNGYPRPLFPASALMNFEDGHRTEDLTADRIRMVDGIELHTHKPDGQQWGFSVLNNKFRGHCDGFIRGLKQAPKTPHVWEAKACNQKKYNEFKATKQKYGEKQTLENWNYTYFVQAQLYMHYFDLKRHYTTVALAGGREYDSCRTEYQKNIALKYIDRAEKIINATQPPPRLSEESDYYICKWCAFSGECHK